MAIPKSRRAKIMVNLERQLKTIKVAAGYATDVYDVTTRVRNWHETPAPETPVLYLIDENTNYQYHAGKLTERDWTMAVYGVMKDSSQVQMEELIADIEECLFKNVTLSFDSLPGVLSHIRITNITTDNQMFSEIEGSQLFKVTLQLKYTACVDAIR